jgi:hypothetical protein
MKGRLLLDVIVRQGPTVLKLFSSEDQTLLIRGNSFFLLIRGNSFFLLNLALHVVDGIRRFDLQGDGLARHYDVVSAAENHMKPFGNNIHVFTKICMPPRRRSTR